MPPLILHDYIFLGFALKDFSLNTERNFTKTTSNNIQLRQITSYSTEKFFEREEFGKNDVHTP